MDQYVYSVGIVCLLTSGCTTRQVGYTALGAGAGGGIGYFLHHDGKEAVIGGLAGALAGDLGAQWQDKSDKVKHDKVYEEGYKQAKVDIAVKNWEDNTGKGTAPKKRLVNVLVPKGEKDNVIYDQREITLEDYR